MFESHFKANVTWPQVSCCWEPFKRSPESSQSCVGAADYGPEAVRPEEETVRHLQGGGGSRLWRISSVIEAPCYIC